MKPQVYTRPHRCNPRHNPGIWKIRSEAPLGVRSGRNGQNPNYAGKNTKKCGRSKACGPYSGRRFMPPFAGNARRIWRNGLTTLNEGQTVEYELVTNRGKTSAENLKVS